MITDTADGIAGELVQAKLVDPNDVEVVASNLQKLVNTPSVKDPVTGTNILRSLVFALVSTSHAWEIFACVGKFCMRESVAHA